MFKYIKNMYKKLLLVTIFSSVTTALVLNLAEPYVMSHVAFSQTSIHVLRIASIANVFLSFFTANALLLMLTNKIKFLAVVAMISASIVMVGGIIFARSGFENLVFAYLIASVFLGVVSTIYANKVAKNAGSILFSRLM